MKRISRLRKSRKASSTVSRAHITFICIGISFFLIITRLAYWQLIRAGELSMIAENQYQRSVVLNGHRGSIYFNKGEPLAVNQRLYNLFAQPHLIDRESKKELATSIAKLLVDPSEVKSDEYESLKNQTVDNLYNKLSQDKKWVILQKGIDDKTKEAIASQKFQFIGFDAYEYRYYPESSMAARIVGFVGKSDQGDPIGFFGLEGGLNNELSPRVERKTQLTDALGIAFISDQVSNTSLDGRSFTLTIRRDLQNITESILKGGVQKYGAESGEIVVINPKSGDILALASYPTFNPSEYGQVDEQLFRNPSVSDLYEPGSTFKVLTVAAGIDAGVITPETTCPSCAGPRIFGQYKIKTWNDQYHPNISMIDAIAKSDNTAMIYVSERLGAEKFRKYLEDFGIGQITSIEIQGEATSSLPEKWRPVEMATTSFGQGVVTTSLQLIKAVAAIANGGQLMNLRLIKSVYDPITNQTIETPISPIRNVISAQSAETMVDIMVNAAKKGEAQWTYQPDRTVAGKTGTSQIASKGGYAENQTIASFIGFAPAYNPQFLMLVKLNKPGSSPWAAETAAPLWYKVADQLYLLMDIPPDRAQ